MNTTPPVVLLRATRALLFSLAVLLAATSSAQAVNVAVLYFDNNSGMAKYDVLNKGLADMIITDLAAVPGLTLVERSRLEDILAEQKLQKSKLFDQKTSVKVGKLLGARYAVTGAVAAVEPKMRMDIRLIDVQTSAIVVADKVVGDSAKFFELEKTLIERFVKGLNKEMPKALQKADSLGTVLDYSNGLDLADKGDYKAASQKLASLMSSAPQFQLAKTRYQEFLKKLYAAKAKRKTDMGTGAQALLDAADAILGQPAKGKKKKALSEHFAYRILRGHMILAQIKKVTGAADSNWRKATVTQAMRPRVERLVKGWSNNQGALIAEMIEARSRKMSRSYNGFIRAKEEHEKLAKELGAGNSPARIAFLSPDGGARGHAKFLCLGRPAFFSSVSFGMSPSPAEMNPGYGTYAIALYEWAIADILANEKMYKEREHIRALDEYGDCLMQLKRKTDAISKWQIVLDKYPTSSQFPKIEKKIKKALGVP